MAALSLTVFLDLVGFGMILPMLPFYAETFGASPLQIGFLFASYSLAQFICSPLWGRISDRIGRRNPLLLTILLGGLAYLLLAAAPTLGFVFLARALAGAAAANYTIAQAFAADITAPKDRARTMGWLGAAFGLGFVAGPAIGGGLSHLGAAAVPMGAAILAAINFVFVWRTVRDTPRTASAGKSIPAERRVGIGRWNRRTSLVALYGVVIFGFSAMEATLALFCEERLGFGIRKTSLLFVFVGLLMVLVQAGLIGKLVARFGERRLLVAGLCSMTAGMLYLAAVESISALLLAAGLLAIGSALYNPSAFGLISRLTPADSQGSVLGTARSLGALARVAGPIWGGWAFHRLGLEAPFLSAGALLGLTILAALWMSNRHLQGAESHSMIGETS